MTEACEFDMGDCDSSNYGGYSSYGGYGGNCAPGCYEGWPGDGICDVACMTEACEFDKGDCDISDSGGYGGYADIPASPGSGPDSDYGFGSTWLVGTEGG